MTATTTNHKEFAELLDQAVQRAKRETALHRMLVWLLALRQVFADLTAGRRQAYEHLMHAEQAIARGDAPAALERIGLAKGLLTALLLALVIHGVLTQATDEFRRPAGRITVRVARRGRADSLNSIV